MKVIDIIKSPLNENLKSWVITELIEIAARAIAAAKKFGKELPDIASLIRNKAPGVTERELATIEAKAAKRAEAILKAEEKGLDFDTFEKLRQGLYGTRKQKTLDFIRTGKVDLEPMKPATTFEEVQDRHRTAAKAADEIFPNYNNPKTAASELANVMAEQKHGKTFDNLSGDQQHDLYSEAYNYITSVNRLPKVSPANVPSEVLGLSEALFLLNEPFTVGFN
jgi:hypothetical protein